MAVSEETRRALYNRAGGHCECEMQVCDHVGRRCTRSLAPGYGEAHHRTAGGPELQPDEPLQATMDRGICVTEIARSYVPDAVLIDLPHDAYAGDAVGY